MAIIRDWTKDVAVVSSTCFSNDKIYILTNQEVMSRPAEENKKIGTDFAISNRVTSDNKTLRVTYMVSNGEHVDLNGQYSSSMDSYSGLAPCLTLNIPKRTKLKNIEQRVGKVEFDEKTGQHLISFGEYPQHLVSDVMNDILEEAYNGGNLQNGMSCTGRIFTNKLSSPILYSPDNLTLVASPEFEFQGQRYVRSATLNSIPYSATYSDGKIRKSGSVRFFKVEPIKFIIKNYDSLAKGKARFLILESKDVLTGGADDFSIWSDSTSRAMLNDFTLVKPQESDCTRLDFLHEALNMTREPERTLIIPETISTLGKSSLNGCVGIEKLVLHKKFRTISQKALQDCNFKVSYRLKSNDSLVLAHSFPIDEEIYDKLDLDKARAVFPDFSYQMLVDNKYHVLCQVVNSLYKNKIKMPYALSSSVLNDEYKFKDFLQDGEFKFIKGEPIVLQTINDLANEYAKEKHAQFSKVLYKFIGLYMFMFSLGCFSSEKLRDSTGKDSNICIGQKATGLMAQFLKAGFGKQNELSEILNRYNSLVYPDQDFLEFIDKRGPGNSYPRIQLLLEMEEKYPCILYKIMGDLQGALDQRTVIGENGMPHTIPLEKAFENFYLEKNYPSVMPKHKEIALTFASKGVSEYIFKSACDMYDLAESRKIPFHILRMPLREKTIAESIEEIKKDTSLTLEEGKRLIDELYKKQFTYEFLAKNDPKNAIIGLYCDCCAVIFNGAYGEDIAQASILKKDVQNLVVRDKKGNIVAKGAMYVNKEYGYAVINDFEMNSEYRKGESISGLYNSPDNNPQEINRQRIFNAFMRGIRDFVNEYDKEHPKKPLRFVNVGMGFNKLKKQCDEFQTATKNLAVPKEYNFSDTTDQRVLYRRGGDDEEYLENMPGILDDE